MADMYRYTLEEPARLLYSNIVEKSAPPGISDAKPRYSGTFGVSEKDFEKIRALMVDAIKSTLGTFSGNPADYYLPCLSGKAMADRTIQTAEFKARGLDPDAQFKMKEKAEKRAEMYRQYPAILTASSQFEISLARLEGGKIVDIGTSFRTVPAFNQAGEPVSTTVMDDRERLQAGKDYFYPGAWVAPAIAIKGTKRKKLDDKDGCTAFLQNVLFIRKGERLGGAGPDNNMVYGSWAGYSDTDPTALAPQEPEAQSAW
jgi:hypothetical protein